MVIQEELRVKNLKCELTMCEEVKVEDVSSWLNSLESRLQLRYVYEDMWIDFARNMCNKMI